MIFARPAGFGRAPVTKGLVLTTAGSSIVFQAASLKDLPSFVRPLRRSFAFRNTGELVFGLALLYYFRLLERQYGSAKFAGYAFVTSTLSYGLQLGLQSAYRLRGGMPTGPYGLIFASFVPFIFDVPPTTRFTMFGMQLSDKLVGWLGGRK